MAKKKNAKKQNVGKKNVAQIVAATMALTPVVAAMPVVVSAAEADNAKMAADTALSTFTATNSTDAAAVLTAVENAITTAGITNVTAAWSTATGEGFSQTTATTTATGSVTGKIVLTDDASPANTATVDVSLTIAKLAAPSTDADKVAAAKAEIIDGTVDVAHGADAAAKLAAVQRYVNGLITNGVTAIVTANQETGKYDVALSSGTESDNVTITITFNEAPAPVAPKPFSITGSIDRSDGIIASVIVTPDTDSTVPAGDKVVIFQLMNGSTPVSIVALKKDIQSAENLTAYFNVQGTGYTVNVFVASEFSTSLENNGDSLATPVQLQ